MSDIHQLAERRARLSPEQQARLVQRLRGLAPAKWEQAQARRGFRAELAKGAAPLSFSQQRMWFLWKLDPSSAAYHLSGGLRFDGPLDAAALRESLNALVQRHAALRTVFREGANGTVEQLALPAASLPMPCVDLTSSDAGLIEQRLHDEVQRLCGTPFDLAEGPLLRAALLRCGDSEHRLIVVMHHIVSDAHSTHIILDELAALYRAKIEGEPPQLANLPLEYADYAAWQRSWLAGEEGERQLAWWKSQLAASQGDDAPVLALAADHPRKADGIYSAATHSIDIDAQLVAALRQAVQAQGCTLFMALLTGFQSLLFRHTGVPDIRIGVPVANRNSVETVGVAGFFVNTQVLRAQVDERDTLSQLLLRTREVALDAQAHQDLPFERLVEHLQPARSLSHTPLFQVMFNHLRRDDRSLQGWPRLAVQRLDFDAPNAQFELTLETCEHAGGQVEANFRYARELFEPETIARLAGHYLAMLQALAAQPQQTVGEVGLIGQDESALLACWSDGGPAWPDAQPVHRLFERQVLLQPQAPALACGEQLLSYAELNARANRLAYRLAMLGVGPESRVGIAMERSVEMVVGLLAIMKAGGAYVPLDPEYPSERLAYMMEDSGIRLLLTQRGLRLPVAASLPVVELDALDLSNEPAHDLQVALHGENLAYVIYTSGSTGKPKGAANRHNALFNRLAWMQDAYRIGGSDTVLQKTPFSFDVSVWEFFWPLMVGARLAMAGPGEHRDPARLVDLIERYEVTTLHFVPSMLQAFLAQPGIEACNSIRRIICSGEALPAEAQQGVFARLPQAQLYNLYGPTEAAIDVTHWTCRDDGRNQVPIGQPISGIRTLVLDAGLNLTPAGVAGELYLGGIGLARGYLGRAALTAERFVADPFDGAGERLYRTGDLVRWNAQGQLEYLGRLDHQVKIRGLRIELGEIEAALLALPEVREAVVVAQPGAGGARLVAYVSAHAGQSIDSAALRERLGRTLADYMVPALVVTLETLPLNANGKVDRKALPAAEPATSAAYEAPQGEVEEALAAIWCEVLGLERVGRHDNFFESGGHSLMAVQVAALLTSRHACEIPVRTFFEAPTIASLSARLPAERWQGSGRRDARMAQMDLLMNEFEV